MKTRHDACLHTDMRETSSLYDPEHQVIRWIHRYGCNGNSDVVYCFDISYTIVTQMNVIDIEN